MFTLLALITLAFLLDVCAMRWGVSSIDGPDSPEWERRRLWYGFVSIPDGRVVKEQRSSRSWGGSIHT